MKKLFFLVLLSVGLISVAYPTEVKQVRTIVRTSEQIIDVFCVGNNTFVSETFNTKIKVLHEGKDGSDLVLSQNSSSSVEKMVDEKGVPYKCLTAEEIEAMGAKTQQ